MKQQVNPPVHDSVHHKNLKLIGEMIKDARNARTMKMDAVSKELHIDASVLSRIENGLYTGLKYTMLADIFKYYGIPMQYLPQ